MVVQWWLHVCHMVSITRCVSVTMTMFKRSWAAHPLTRASGSSRLDLGIIIHTLLGHLAPYTTRRDYGYTHNLTFLCHCPSAHPLEGTHNTLQW